MFFRRKRRLRKEFDEKLLNRLNQLKIKWTNNRAINEKIFDPSEEFIFEVKLSEAKYFFLLHEAKERNITIQK
ncbi:YaaL family protein [Bacillus aquiflavi]|uniref:YaaL family protein n=1 Tax=Bacillus aquiflavi TaxID=2672567 RepID=A0A6B3VXC2_9BACI|nr:YaaL family protein [Bacillus aquiflavi]MBA4537681.1 YaaL family protein [Bacillus aquiflavi]NEY81938.1 YaaL family protein [Bacillus aquiflavi]